MRVIEENKQERMRKCETCKSLIAYNAKDIHGLIYKYIKCPVCGNDSYISMFDKRVK